jgi:hypothetical protein
LDPFAYGLRDHDIFRTPLSIDRSRSVRVPVPDAWKKAINEESIEVLPLVTNTKRNYNPGWCTYVYEHAQMPELEVLCGGINSKTPKAGAIWRQGNLLHFGFEQSPAEMNDIGLAMLVNSIAYIARFTEDRPIALTPSVFSPNGGRIFDRDVIGRLTAHPSRDLAILKYYVSADLYQQVGAKSRSELAEWFRDARPWLRADDDGKLILDEEARSFGASPERLEFFEQAIAALRESGEQARLARKLLERYAPDGPDPAGSAANWASWAAENKPYLFFSDTGGYRWYVDPLAKKRQTPTDQLRGPNRATLPPIGIHK